MEIRPEGVSECTNEFKWSSSNGKGVLEGKNLIWSYNHEKVGHVWKPNKSSQKFSSKCQTKTKCQIFQICYIFWWILVSRTARVLQTTSIVLILELSVEGYWRLRQF